MARNYWSQKNVYKLYALLMTILFILFYGYAFNKGDQAEHLPQVYRLLHPELYQHDFFLTLYDQTFTVREYWVWLVYGVSQVIPIEWTCFVLHFTAIFFTGLAWMLITKHVTENIRAAYIAPFFLFFLFHSFTVGGNTLLGNTFVGSIPAEALASWGIYYWLKEKKNKASILLGLATLFQLLVGIQLFFILSLLHLVSQRTLRGYLIYVKYGLIYLVTASPLLIPVFHRQFFTSYTSSEWAVFYETLFYQRAPWHYLPSLFPLPDWIKLMSVLAVSLICIRWLKSNARVHDIKLIFMFISLGCLFSLVMIEGLHVLSIGKLQWFKATVWLNAFSGVLISGAIAARLEHQIISKTFFKPMLMLAMGFIFFGIIVITQSSMISFTKQLNGRFMIGSYNKSDLQKMHEWIRDNTPKDALFLTPPDDDAFNCEAQRSTVVNYKALVHEPFYMIQWRNAMSKYYLVDFDSLGHQLAFTVTQWNYQNRLQEVHDFDYRLDNLKLTQISDSLGQVIHQQGSWLLTAVRH